MIRNVSTASRAFVGSGNGHAVSAFSKPDFFEAPELTMEFRVVTT